MLNKIFLKNTFFIFLTAFLFFSCKKNNSSDPQIQVEEPNNTVNTQVFGIVTDENNKPIAGVNITINNQSVKTDNNGIFTNKNITTTQRTVLKANFSGYFQSIHLLELDSKKTESVQIKLQKKVVLTTFNTSNGATTNIGNSGASVVFPANGYVTANNQPYTGSVKIFARFANIDSPDFIQTVPRTMRATDANGTISRLETFGMMEVLMEDASGNPLQLSNSKAKINMPIANSQTSTAPQSIPLWHLDENTGVWKEEGSATKQGNMYVGEVSHFTWWNCDIAQPIDQRASIKGRTVRMVNGVAVPVNGIYIYSTLGGQGYVDSDGKFGYSNVAAVTSGTPLAISFYNYWNCSLNYQNISINIPALYVGQVYDMGDIDVSSFSQNFITVMGNVNNCNNTSTGEFASFTAFNLNDQYLWSGFTNASGQILFPTCQIPSKIVISHISGETQTITNIVSPNLGTITLNCLNADNDNEYIINGDGFNNLKIVDTNPVLPRVYVRDSLVANQMVTLYTINDFPNPNPHTFSNTNIVWGVPMIPPYTIGASIYFQGGGTTKYYAPVSGQTTITSETATEVKGTYSGVVKNMQTNALANIYNGKFRVIKQ